MDYNFDTNIYTQYSTPTREDAEKIAYRFGVDTKYIWEHIINSSQCAIRHTRFMFQHAVVIVTRGVAFNEGHEVPSFDGRMIVVFQTPNCKNQSSAMVILEQVNFFMDAWHQVQQESRTGNNFLPDEAFREQVQEVANNRFQNWWSNCLSELEHIIQ